MTGLSLTTLWCFDEVASQDETRANRLRNAPAWPDMTLALSDALHAALSNRSVRFGFEESSRDSADLRAVVQFPIGARLFDCFFNARTGYRAQFRCGCGAEENARLVAMLRREIEVCAQKDVAARRLSCLFEDVGEMVASVQDVAVSLDPALSKVWFCGKLIESSGGVEAVSVFTTGPRLLFDDGCEPWCSLYAEEGNAWLDLKGAFVGKSGRYQPKDPGVRARGLQARGTA
jgi:hypothetical protein